MAEAKTSTYGEAATTGSDGNTLPIERFGQAVLERFGIEGEGNLSELGSAAVFLFFIKSGINVFYRSDMIDALSTGRKPNHNTVRRVGDNALAEVARADRWPESVTEVTQLLDAGSGAMLERLDEEQLANIRLAWRPILELIETEPPPLPTRGVGRAAARKHTKPVKEVPAKVSQPAPAVVTTKPSTPKPNPAPAHPEVAVRVAEEGEITEFVPLPRSYADLTHHEVVDALVMTTLANEHMRMAVTRYLKGEWSRRDEEEPGSLRALAAGLSNVSMHFTAFRNALSGELKSYPGFTGSWKIANAIFGITGSRQVRTLKGAAELLTGGNEEKLTEAVTAIMRRVLHFKLSDTPIREAQVLGTLEALRRIGDGTAA